jgi:L-rhamnose mutarotase
MRDVDYIHYEPATSLLFATFRYIGYDYAGDMERMRENAKVREWWKITDAMQESLNDDAVSSEQSSEKLDDGSGGEGKVPDWWRGVESVFYAP